MLSVKPNLRLFLVLALAWPLRPLVAVPESRAAQIYEVGPDEAAVYAAYFKATYKRPRTGGPLARLQLIVENEHLDQWQPNRRAWERYLLKRLTGPGAAARETAEAFVHRPVRVMRIFSLPEGPLPVRLVRSDEINRHLRLGWDEFYRAYPGSQGFISLSAVVFDLAHEEAVFAARSACGKKCGYRSLLVMKKINGEWELVIKESLP